MAPVLLKGRNFLASQLCLWVENGITSCRLSKSRAQGKREAQAVVFWGWCLIRHKVTITEHLRYSADHEGRVMFFDCSRCSFMRHKLKHFNDINSYMNESTQRLPHLMKISMTLWSRWKQTDLDMKTTHRKIRAHMNSCKLWSNYNYSNCYSKKQLPVQFLVILHTSSLCVSVFTLVSSHSLKTAHLTLLINQRCECECTTGRLCRVNRNPALSWWALTLAPVAPMTLKRITWGKINN